MADKDKMLDALLERLRLKGIEEWAYNSGYTDEEGRTFQSTYSTTLDDFAVDVSCSSTRHGSPCHDISVRRMGLIIGFGGQEVVDFYDYINDKWEKEYPQVRQSDMERLVNLLGLGE